MDNSKHYCVYLTIYTGNKLPPFYIGSSSIERINSGYRGSVKSRQYRKIWASELKTNPHLFDIKIISLHNSRHDATLRENEIQHKLNVVVNPLYINRAHAIPGGFSDIDTSGPNNGMYGRSKRGKLNPMYGKRHSQETRDKISKTKIGKKLPPRNENYRTNMSLATMGIPKRRVVCPHCGVEGGSNNMYRWHFDNCKRRIV